MPSVQITAETINAQTGQNATLFNPFSPYLRLSSRYTLSPDLASLPNVVVEIIFQLINLHTNQVFFNNPGQHPVPQGDATGGYTYDINPSNTVGMQWSTGADIFGFRAAVSVSQNNAVTGLQAIDALAVSDIQWFRLEDISTL